jgi:hypothetical protein
MVVLTSNPSTLEVEAERSQVQSQPGLPREPCLKRKKKHLNDKKSFFSFKVEIQIHKKEKKVLKNGK